MFVVAEIVDAIVVVVVIKTGFELVVIVAFDVVVVAATGVQIVLEIVAVVVQTVVVADWSSFS